MRSHLTSSNWKLAVCLAVVALGVLSSAGPAGTIYWTGDNGGNWDTGSGNSNWSTSSVSNIDYGRRPQNGDVLVIDEDLWPGYGWPQDSTLNFSGLTVGGITIRNFYFDGVSIAGNQTIHLDGNINLLDNGRPGFVPRQITFAPSIVLDRDSVWTHTAAEIYGESGTADVYFTGNISGSHSLTLAGTPGDTWGHHAFYFSGTNTHTGGTILDGTTLHVQTAVADSALGSAGARLTMQNSAALYLSCAGAAQTISRPITVASGMNTIWLGGCTDTRYLTISGGISGAGGVTITGEAGSTVKYTGNNSYTGETDIYGTLILGTGDTINNAAAVRVRGQLKVEQDEYIGDLLGYGKLTIDNGVLFAVTGGGTTEFTGTIDGGGVFRKSGTGKLTLTKANSYSGGTQIAGGTLEISDGASLGAAGGTVTLSGGALRADPTNLQNFSVLLEQDLVLGGGTIIVADESDRLTIDGAISGSGALSKSGAGRLVLTGPGSYTNATLINAGALEISAASQIGGASGVTIDGGTLALSGDMALLKAITLGGGGGAIEVAQGKVASLLGAVQGGRLTKTGYGTLGLLAAGSYSGANVQAGVLMGTTDSLVGDIAVVGSAEIAFSQNSDGVYAGRLTGSLGPPRFRKLGTGAVTLTGDNSGFDGPMYIEGGAIAVASPASLSDYSVLLNGGGLKTTASFSVAAPTLLGDGVIDTAAGVTLTLTSSMTGSGRLTKAGDGALVLPPSVYSGGTRIEAGTLRLIGAVPRDSVENHGVLEIFYDNVVNGTATLANFSGDGTLVKTGAGSVTLAGTNTGAGRTRVLDGELQVSSLGRLGLAPAGYLADAVLLDGGRLTITATTDWQASRGLTVGSAGGEIDVQLNNTLTMAAPIVGDGGLTKRGGGVLVLAGEGSSYAGPTTVAAGTLRVGVSGAIPNTAPVTLLQNSRLELTTFSERIGGLAGAGDVELGSTTLILSPTQDCTFTGHIDGQGNLRLDGNHSQTLTAANGYTGLTEILHGTLIGGSGFMLPNSGRVQIGNAADAVLVLGGNETIGSLAGGGSAGGTVDLNGFALTTGGNGESTAFAGRLLGPGSLVKTGDGTFTLSGVGSTYAGGTTVSAGRLVATAASLPGNVVDNATLEFAQAIDGAFAGQISGSGSLVKTGAGRLTLAAGNSYAGRTTVAGGVLAIPAESALGAAGGFLADRIRLEGGTLGVLASADLSASRGITLAGGGGIEVASGATVSLAGPIAGDGGLTKSGPGVLVLGGANSYAGGTTIAAGTLRGDTTTILGSIVNNGVLEIVQDFDATLPAASGTGRLVKAGDGVLTLGSNTQAGGLAVLGGTVRISGVVQLGALPGSTVSDYLTLDGGTLATTGASSWNSRRGVTLGVAGGTIDVADLTRIDLSAGVTGPGGLTKTGGGTLSLAGANSYAGGTTVSEGVLSGSSASLAGEIVNNATVEFVEAVGGTFAGRISGVGQVVKTGGGTLNLAGGQSYSGATAVNAGLLYAFDNALSPASAVTVAAGAELHVSGDGATAGLAGGGTLRLSGGELVVDSDSDATFSGPILGTGTIVKDGSGRWTVSGSAPAQVNYIVSQGRLVGHAASLVGSIANYGQVEFAQSADGLYAGAIGGTGSLFKSGPGTLTLGYANSYSGSTTVTGGTLKMGAATALPSGGPVTVNGATLDMNGYSRTLSLTLTGATVNTGGGTLTLTGGGITAVASDTSSTITGKLNVGSAEPYVTVYNGDAMVDLLIDGDISGSGGWIKEGEGTLSLGGLGSYGGTLQIEGGTLRTATAGALSPTAGVTVTGALLEANYDQAVGGLKLTGGTVLATSLTLGGDLTSEADSTSSRVAGAMNIGKFGRSVTVADGPAAVDLDLAADLTGAGGLRKNGPGLLALGGTNSFTGGLHVQAGTVRIDDPAALPADALSVDAGGTLLLGGVNAAVESVTLTGGQIDSGVGKLTLGSYLSAVSSGTMAQVRGRIDLGATTTTFNVADGPLPVDMQIDAAVSSAGGALRKSGAGLLVLTGVNSYTGGTQVEGGGTLRLEADGALPAGGNVSVTASRLDLGETSQAIGSLTLNGAEVSGGSGVLTLGGPVTVAGSPTGSRLDGRVDLGGAMRWFSVGNGSAESDLTISGRLIGQGGIGQDSGGTLTLEGDNSFGGGIRNFWGVISAGQDSALGDASNVISLGQNGTLRVTGTAWTGTARGLDLLVGGGRIELADPSLTFTMTGAIGGAGSLTKLGAGTLVLSGANSYSGSTYVNAGVLRAGSATGLSAASGLTIAEGAAVELGGLSQSIDRLSGAGRLDLGGATLTVGSAGGTSLFGGELTGGGGLIKAGSGEFTLAGDAADGFAGPTVIDGGRLVLARTISGAVTMNSGTLRIDSGAADTTLSALTLNGGEIDLGHYDMTAGRVDVAGEVTLRSEYSRLFGKFSSTAGSNLTVAGNLLLGDANTYGGFRANGEFHLAEGASVTISTKGFATLGYLTTIDGGMMTASNGIVLTAGAVLVGNGHIDAKLAAAVGSTIEVTGGYMTLGGYSDVDGFYSDGTLIVGGNSLNIWDANDVVLGSLTTLGDETADGQLMASRSFLLRPGCNLTGHGYVYGEFLADGYVRGDNETGIQFGSLVTGSGRFDGNVTFNGGFSPGHSPEDVDLQNVSFGPTNVLTMELGGLTAGDQYDQLLVAGLAQLDGQLDVVLIDEFQPNLGDSFLLIDAAELAGRFDAFNLPSLSQGLQWNLLQTSDQVTITVVPEPGATALLVGGAMMMLLARRRRSRRRR